MHRFVSLDRPPSPQKRSKALAPGKLQEICDSLGPEEIDRVFRKWLRRIPLPLRSQDRDNGYDWNLSMWQVEVSLTQIFDRPVRGREFFEEVIRDNLWAARIECNWFSAE